MIFNKNIIETFENLEKLDRIAMAKLTYNKSYSKRKYYLIG